MKKILWLALLLVPFAQVATAADYQLSQRNEALIRQLDEVVASKTRYQSRRLERADSLRHEAQHAVGTQRVDLYKAAYDTYSRFLSDSVFSLLQEFSTTPEYAQDHQLQTWVDICTARNYGVMGLYSSSIDILRQYDPSTLDHDLKLLYYNTIHAVTGWMADFSRTAAPHTSDSLYACSAAYLDSVYTLEQDPISRVLIYSTMCEERGQTQQGIDTLLSIMPTCDSGSLVYLYAILAQCYINIGQTEEEIYYLTHTTIHDLQEGVTEYMALPILAKRLQEMGQIERAYNYLVCSLVDASICHSGLRTIETSSFFPIVDGARRAEEKRLQQNRIITFSLASLCAFLILLLIIIYFSMRAKAACLEVDRKKRHLEEMSYTAEHDELTGLYNRLGCKQHIARLIEQRQAGYLGILDVDLFKRVNDTYGHDVGDKVLQAVAQSFGVAPQLIPARMGGDEFIIYTTVPLTATEYCHLIDKFFDAIRAIHFPEMGDHHISVSLGAVYFDGTKPISFDQLYREADLRLYQSKQQPGCHLTL